MKTFSEVKSPIVNIENSLYNCFKEKFLFMGEKKGNMGIILVMERMEII